MITILSIINTDYESTCIDILLINILSLFLFKISIIFILAEIILSNYLWLARKFGRDSLFKPTNRYITLTLHKIRLCV